MVIIYERWFGRGGASEVACWSPAGAAGALLAGANGARQELRLQRPRSVVHPWGPGPHGCTIESRRRGPPWTALRARGVHGCNSKRGPIAERPRSHGAASKSLRGSRRSGRAEPLARDAAGSVSYLPSWPPRSPCLPATAVDVHWRCGCWPSGKSTRPGCEL